jgi:hypothetical protein
MERSAGMFQQVLAAEEQATADGLIDALVEGVYVQPPKVAAPTTAATDTKTTGVAGE